MKVRRLYIRWVAGLLAAGCVSGVLPVFAGQTAAVAAEPSGTTVGLLSAMLAIEWGRTQTDRASLEADGNRRLLLLIAARQSFGRAAAVLQTVEEGAERRVQQFGGPWDIPADASSAALLQDARRYRIESGLYLAGVWHAMGKTYPPRSAPRQRYLAAAAQKYERIYRQHATLAGGLCARICQARVAKDLDQPKEAVEILEGMLNLPDNDDAIRRLRNEALGLLLETYLLPEVKNYAQAMRRAEQWVTASRAGDPAEAGALRIDYLAGLAALEFARALPPGAPKRGESLVRARKSLEFVARCRGPLQQDACRGLADPLFGDWLDEAAAPRSAEQWKYRGDCAWERMLRAGAELREQNGSQTRPAPAERAQTERQFARQRDTALACYRSLASLLQRNAPSEDLIEVRFRLAYLYWATGDLERAAVLGEFIARWYPQCKRARSAAEIAAKARISSLQRLPREHQGPEK
jgi:hypothetical protein